jgi:DHA1 family bicyclomycin/chloramphenicol resistance-like MFS transporter
VKSASVNISGALPIFITKNGIHAVCCRLLRLGGTTNDAAVQIENYMANMIAADDNGEVVTKMTFMAILGALMAFTSLSTDIYLPAMPEMAKDLNGDAELTITGFLVGFTFAQLLWGPISDSIGRKIPLYIGMLVFAIGSVGCAISNSIEEVVMWRVFQAFGACTGPMLARAMIRDLFSRIRAAQMLSTLMIIMAIAPIIGPLLGGQIIQVSNWHAIFWLLTAIGSMMCISLLWLSETLPKEKRKPASIGNAFTNYRYLLKK